MLRPVCAFRLERRAPYSCFHPQAISQFCPNPLRWHNVWELKGGKRDLFGWKGVPPPGFLALGMIVTDSEDLPPLTARVFTAAS